MSHLERIEKDFRALMVRYAETPQNTGHERDAMYWSRRVDILDGSILRRKIALKRKAQEDHLKNFHRPGKGLWRCKKCGVHYTSEPDSAYPCC